MIKLNAGSSRKVGEANYSSRGASVNLELELESAAVRDPDKLHDKIRALFRLARNAVDEELRNSSHRGQVNGNPGQKPNRQDSDGPFCSNCGTGGLSDKVVKYSSDKFGKVLCYSCQRKLNNGKRRR